MAWQKSDRACLPVPRAIRTFFRVIYAPSIAIETPPALHAPPSAADQSREGLYREHRSSAQPIATDSITREMAATWLAIELAAIQFVARVPGRAKKLTVREGTATARHKEKIHIRVHFG
jgi:hypothetical protein